MSVAISYREKSRCKVLGIFVNFCEFLSIFVNFWDQILADFRGLYLGLYEACRGFFQGSAEISSQCRFQKYPSFWHATSLIRRSENSKIWLFILAQLDKYAPKDFWSLEKNEIKIGVREQCRKLSYFLNSIKKFKVLPTIWQYACSSFILARNEKITPLSLLQL